MNSQFYCAALETAEKPNTSQANQSHSKYDSEWLQRATNVLSVAATALFETLSFYQSNNNVQTALMQAINLVVDANVSGGKLVVCGMGKSGLVGKKIVGTMKSFGIASSFLHPSEALHGDLGDIKSNDVILFFTQSGRTAELLAMLPYIPSSTHIIAITSMTHLDECPLLCGRCSSVLLPAPVHQTEETSFGVRAPMTWSLVAMAVGDMLALSAAKDMHQGKLKEVFQYNHPAGAIGCNKTDQVA